VLQKGIVTLQNLKNFFYTFHFRSGILQPGDRILAINGQQLEGMTLEDARSIIKDSNNQIHLEIEFDVAGNYFLSFFFLLILIFRLDSVMLSSGTCQVKILRKNLDLGLSVTCTYSFLMIFFFFLINFI
jgi:hypothetical protein